MANRLESLLSRRHSRRGALAAFLGAGAAAALAACSDDAGEPATGSQSPAGGGQPPTSSGPPRSVAWRQLKPNGDAPLARKDHSLTYDAASGAAYVFGGRSSGTAQNDLWQYDLKANAWGRVQAAGSLPPARFGHNAVFDAPRRRLVVFGGQAGSSFFNDVWTFTPGAGWQQLAAQMGPSPRYGAGGALDAATGAFYVTHGFTFQGRFDDTWRLALGESAWRDTSPSGDRPLPRCLLRSVWDESAKALVLFGGQSNKAPYHDDFWRLSPGGGWTEVKADPRPSARNLYGADYDANGARLVLFGGRTNNGNADDVWAFSSNDSKWTRLAVAKGPSARNSHDAVYLPDRKGLLVFGGSGDQGELNDLWLLELA